ncbi:hypothetical protein AMTR_s00012p00256620 [Amborella trichopoda]|uniref:Transcription factor IIA alpha/beta subunit n=1 Tax=Amborella trichopoda TaxID=13333 RepID=W1PLJ1_AMBTC|nr:hypothetical protein AMTR_s00012p00256620 [Amborella trichopoda]
MANGGVSGVYIHVIEDVVNKVREEFVNVGADENVLNELQSLWELKMMQCGAIQGPLDRNCAPRMPGPITPVHDLNVPYEGSEEYQTPTAEMLFPPTPLQTPIQTPLPGNLEPAVYQYLPAGSGDYGPMHDTGSGGDVKGARPSPYMQAPSPWANQRPLGVDVNVAYVEGQEEEEGGISQQSMPKDFLMMPPGKRKREDYGSHYLSNGYNIPQQDGSGDITLGFEAAEMCNLR